MKPVFSIDAGVPFLDALATGLLARAGGNPLDLARMTVLLPTRRAGRALAEAFLRAGSGKPMLLPRLVPVGDLDAEELAILADESAGTEGLDLPPPVPDLARRLMLARLVLRWGERRGIGRLSAAQAAPLAAELARFLDEVGAEGCDFTKLADLAPEAHAQHWQQVLTFLRILTEHWPTALAELGGLDPAARRNRVLAAQAEAWRANPPAHPVIAAGIAGGIPAISDLIAEVAELPQGMVVLPGLDRALDAESWDAVLVDPAHPQHLLAVLLGRLDIAPKSVRPFPAPGFASGNPARQKLLREALRPADVSHRWGAISGIGKVALDGLRRVDCPGPQEEAVVIALLMRERLQHPGETAALVTPDRGLARRVAGELRRWDIEIDDSAGTPLAKTPPAVFLRLILDAVAGQLAPLALLALLKHPLAAAGLDPAACRELARKLERAALRGPRPAPGVAGLQAALAEPALKDFVARIGRALAPLTGAMTERETELASLVAAHAASAENLAATDAAPGRAALWRAAAGEALAQWVSELHAAPRGFPPVAGAEYPALFEALIAGPVVRPAYGRHPRLFIWGLLEARLQSADLIILGGLNEGIWPPRAESDPWLSRPMRRDFGLPPPERRIGRAAHDFAQCLGAPEVVLTRATRVEGAPTVPSRWLLRLETVLRALKLETQLYGDSAESGAPLAWAALLDQPAAHRPIAAPLPRPPVAVRPRRLHVTEIETWVRDPYAIYARHVLDLKALEPLDADPGVAERGIFIHAALDKFLKAFPAELPDDASARLLEFGRDSFGEALARPNVRAFWWPRFERIAAWVVKAERARRPLLAQSFGELRGNLTMPAAKGAFEISGRADRIDRLHDGNLVILDYKTGTLPPPGEIHDGYASQLAFEAVIARAGGFPGVKPAEVEALLYWRLSGGEPPGEDKAAARGAAAVAALADRAKEGLARLIAAFDRPETPYRSWPNPSRGPRYSDYVHLARVKEWLLGAETEDKW
ncbi:MAG TPA: double-strand break repair protein AddB [Stellaceae bacterium]|nr:double-strand break repair protein AddB [Stellaceae bacterium]